MPRKDPPEFKRDVVTVARRGDLTVAEVAVDFGVAEETVCRWMKQADVDVGIKDGLTTTEQAEIVRLRRDKRRLAMESEVLRRAAACFAASSLQKFHTRWSVTWPPRGSRCGWPAGCSASGLRRSTRGARTPYRPGTWRTRRRSTR